MVDLMKLFSIRSKGLILWWILVYLELLSGQLNIISFYFSISLGLGLFLLEYISAYLTYLPLLAFLDESLA